MEEWLQGSAALLLLAAVGGVLVDSGLAKLGKVRLVTDALVRQGLPGWLARLAGFLPGAELVLALLLVLPPTRTLGAALAAVTFSAFASYMAWLWASHPGESCHCFGNSAAVTLRHVILDLVLGMAAVALAAGSTMMQPGVPAAAAGMAIGAGAVACRAWRIRSDRPAPGRSSQGEP
jgi:hypothetical protein